MTPGRDLSLTAWTRPALADEQPRGGGAPSLMLDFARGRYLRGAGFVPLEQVLRFARATSATCFGADGLMQTAAADAPRFENDPATGAARGLLLEEAATNLLLHSTALPAAGWGESVTSGPGSQVLHVQANAGLAPDGTMTAAKLTESTDFDLQRISMPTLNLTGGATYTFSVFAKAAERRVIQLRARAADGADFDLLSGTWTPVGAPVAAGMTPVGNGWYRCWVATVAATSAEVQWIVLHDGNGTTYAGDGMSGVHLWGTQFEQGRGPSSLIVTGASPVTRANDDATVWGDLAALGIGTAFTALVLGHHPRPTEFLRADALRLLPEELTLAVRDFTDEGNLSPYFENRTGNVVRTSNAATGVVADKSVKLALAGDAVSTTGAANGGIVWERPVGAERIAPINAIRIGARNAGDRLWGGTISRIVIWPGRLSDPQLREMTA